MSAKPKPLKAQHSVAELKAHYRKSTCPVERRRTQAIWLLMEGKKRKEVEELVGYSKLTLRRVIERYEREGLAGLRDLRHENQGAPPLLRPEEVAELARVVREDYQRNVLWKGKKVVEWVKDQLGKEIYPQRAFEYLAQIGFSKQSPRRRHKKADKVRQEEFKKNAAREGESYT